MNVLLPPSPPLPSAWPDAARAARVSRRMAAFYLLLVLALLLLLATPATRMLLTLRAGGLGGLVVGALLIPLAGLLATQPLARARLRLGQPATASLPPRWARRVRLPRWGRSGPADAAVRLARLARRPQGVIIPAIGVSALLLLWSLPPRTLDPATGAIILGAAAIVLGFPLLVCERIMAAVPRHALPEAAGLQALLFVPVLVVPLAGLLEIGAALGIAWARPLMALPALYVGLVAAELTLRSLANWFLPPPAPVEARAAVASLAALLLQPRRLAPDGLAAPIRTHLGLDFSRSWALRYARSAALPIGLALAAIAWGLTGVSLIDLDQRGIYERFGAPVAVWAPGAHLGLPWPLGRVRRVDFGVVHAVPLGGDAAPFDRRALAESPPPPSADRLWEEVHPSEVSYLIASQERGGQQGFQTVSVDLRALYRIGLDDHAALLAAYAVDAPDALVRAEAGRLMARVFAGKELAAVLGDGRETLAEGLRARLQAELDRLQTGIELVALEIEAIHPPPGAAEAYHNVQAAEIIANTAIATERGRALATGSRARQLATDLTMTADASAADTVGKAKVAARTFTADQDAAGAGGSAFLLERYLTNVATALARSPLVIVDRNLAGPDAPAIDLRSFGAPSTRTGDED